jgi:hypothetical protein
LVNAALPARWATVDPLWGEVPFARLVKLGSGAFAKGAECLDVTHRRLSPFRAQAPSRRGEYATAVLPPSSSDTAWELGGLVQSITGTRASGVPGGGESRCAPGSGHDGPLLQSRKPFGVGCRQKMQHVNMTPRCDMQYDAKMPRESETKRTRIRSTDTQR